MSDWYVAPVGFKVRRSIRFHGDVVTVQRQEILKL